MTGEQLAFAARDEALDRVNRNAEGWEKAVIDQAVLALAEQGPVSANSFRHLLPEITNRNVIGGRLAALGAARRLRKVGEVVSTDPGTHAKKIGLWALVRECPNCEGSGEIVRNFNEWGKPEPDQCWDCRGCGAVADLGIDGLIPADFTADSSSALSVLTQEEGQR